ITVTTPAAGGQTLVNVKVTNPDTGFFTATNGYNYQIVNPTVSLINPGGGLPAGGTVVTITGTGFVAGATVKFGAAAPVLATTVTGTSITVTAPANPLGAANVLVGNPDGGSVLVTGGFLYAAAPTVGGVLPGTGSMLGGTTITITGTNFYTGAIVTMVGAPTVQATNVVVVNSTTITATTPAHAAGFVDVVVSTASGNSLTSAADGFTYVAVAAPTVTAVSPNSGPIAGGTSITITGTNLTGASAVTIGGAAATSFTVVNATTITAVTPAHAAGVVDVVVTTPGGPSATSPADQFTYTTAPTVTAVSPNSGPLAGGTSITITGTNLTGAMAVTIGGTAATSFTVVNATTITAVTPAHAVGIVDVTVTTPSGTSALVAADKFTYAAAPTVTAVSPNSGPLTGGTSITITGTNFTGATAVTVGGVAATSVVVVNATTITATTPAHAAGLVDVTVTTPSGTSPTSAADKFTYSTVPSVTAVSPSTGPSTGGTSITITGTNFTGTTGVTVGGVAATGVVVVNATTITATTPAHAVGLVDVIVTTPNGTSAITAADNFTYVVAPTVTAVSPNIGPIAGGTAITITGTNFTGATVVTVGGVAATSVVVVSATSITAVTPAHAAGLVDVIVTTPGGPSATSAADKFNYDSTGPTVTIGTPSAATTATGPVTYTITYADANFNASTLTAANVTLNKTGTANGIVSVDSGTGTTRTVTISGITGDGTLGISLAAGTANDTAGNQAPAAGPSTTFVVSNLASFAVGDVGGAVRMVNALTGDVVSLVRPLDTATSQYKGLVEVALGRFNGDGIDDLAVAAADPLGVNGLSASKSGKVFIYDGAALATGTLTLIRTFTPFATHDGPDVTGGPYFNGLNIALGDVNGDNQIDLIAGTRGGNGTTAGLQEYGRLVVIDGNSPSGLNNVIGGIQTPFGSGYQKGVIVAAGNVDGLGGDEIAVTRGGPVASSNPAVQQIKVKVLQLQGGALAELPLAANGSTAFAPFGSLSGPANAISRDGRVAFVDSNGDGKDELVFSALDPLTNPANEQVRVGVYSINVSASLGAASIVSTGPDQGTYRTGVAVVDHSTTHVAATGLQQNLALLTQSASPGVVYLAPLTGASLGGFGLSVLDGGIAIAGI
ncbi:MAG: IPT/TIG domain-containing protein, partial [Planctomycetes bacterium]|nr:IPT/TIG domain-containing protein [Planctomycetota bacterium]